MRLPLAVLTTLFAGPVGMLGTAPASALDDYRTAAIVSQCINPDTGATRNTDFCRCFAISQDDTRKWVILPGAANTNAACLRDPTVTGSVTSGDGLGPPAINPDDDDVATVLDPDWPGWGYGDQNHDHAGPPSDPPGQGTPPGQR